jgi:hypothetical protein
MKGRLISATSLSQPKGSLGGWPTAIVDSQAASCAGGDANLVATAADEPKGTSTNFGYIWQKAGLNGTIDQRQLLLK